MKFDFFYKLDREDRQKVVYFCRILLRQKKYKKLKKELEERLNKIERGEILSHEEIWKDLDVLNCIC